MSQSKNPPGPTPPPIATPESWTVVQVSSFLRLPYQTARNNMLAGVYGPSSYDATTRKLTVLADQVRAAKPKRGRKPTRKRTK